MSAPKIVASNDQTEDTKQTTALRSSKQQLTRETRPTVKSSSVFRCRSSELCGKKSEGTPVSLAEAAAASDPGPHKHFAFEKMLTSSLCAVLRGHRGQSLISSRCLVALTINKANETSRPLTSTSRCEAALALQRACLVLARQAAQYLAGPESKPATPGSFVLVLMVKWRSSC